MENGQALVDRYARLIVDVGVALREGQPLLIDAHVEHAPLVRAVARVAYGAGARYVDVRYADDFVKRALIESGPEDMLDHSPRWLIDRVEAMGEEQAAALIVSGEPSPGLFGDLDGRRVGAARMSARSEAWLHEVTEERVSWSIVGCPTVGWAERGFGEPGGDRRARAIA